MVTINGQQIDMAVARNLMDDGICEKIHGAPGIENDQQFVDAYLAAHLAKFGKEFVVN